MSFIVGAIAILFGIYMMVCGLVMALHKVGYPPPTPTHMPGVWLWRILLLYGFVKVSIMFGKAILQ